MDDSLQQKKIDPTTLQDDLGSISFDVAQEQPTQPREVGMQAKDTEATATAMQESVTPLVSMQAQQHPQPQPQPQPQAMPQKAPTAQQEQIFMDPATIVTKDRKIMVVEDDMFISDIYDVKLTSAGYNVILANNGRDAIEKLTAGESPHLMLLDIVMPYMDGFDVLDAIAQNPAWQKIPIVLLTNLSQKEDIDRAMERGAKDYLIKSHFTPSEVLSKVERYIIKD